MYTRAVLLLALGAHPSLYGCCGGDKDRIAPAPIGASASVPAVVATGAVADASSAAAPLFASSVALAWRADSRAFAIAHSPGASIVPVDGGRVTSLAGSRGTVVALAFAGDGATLATVNEAGAVHLWNTASGVLLAELPRPDQDPSPIANGWTVAFSGDGALVAAASDRVRLWDVASRKHVCSADASAVFELRFSADGKSLVGTGVGAFERWDLGTCAVLAQDRADTGGTFGSVLSPDGAWLAASEESGHGLSIFGTQPFRRRGKQGSYAQSAGCEDHVAPWRFSRDGKVLLVTGGTRWFRSFRVGAFTPLSSWKAPTGDPPEVVVPFDDGVHILVRGADGTTTLTDTRAGHSALRLDVMGAAGFDTSPDSAWIVGTTELKALLWEASTARLARTFEPAR